MVRGTAASVPIIMGSTPCTLGGSKCFTFGLPCMGVDCSTQGNHHSPGPPPPSPPLPAPQLLSPHSASPHSFLPLAALTSQLGGPLQGLHAHMDAVIAHPLLRGSDIDFKLQVRPLREGCLEMHAELGRYPETSMSRTCKAALVHEPDGAALEGPSSHTSSGAG